VSYLPIDKKFIGVVSTETEISFFEKKIQNSKFQISNFKIKKKIKFDIRFEIKN
jgi:hypothetical protein